jgi:chemotaxis response regulator CheB/chemotaxis methyl-accepting protein methylase
MKIPITVQDREVIYGLAAALTNTSQEGRYRHSIIVNNVHRRMLARKASTLNQYLSIAERDDTEFAELISALTIHTTQWFREMPHYQKVEEFLNENKARFKTSKFRVLCAASSTGEEPYSFGLMLELFKAQNPWFEYSITASDIDPVSVRTAKEGVYKLIGVPQIPDKYRKFLLKGNGPSRGFFSISSEIKSRCNFAVRDLTKLKKELLGQFDLIVVRNVLIYFDTKKVQEIIHNLTDLLAPEGMLCLGHSEAIEPGQTSLNLVGNACYTKSRDVEEVDESLNKTVLVVDDTASLRKTLNKMLSVAGFKVVQAASAEEASKVVSSTKIDVITLDLNMPGMSGQDWLRLQRKAGMRVPVAILSGTNPEEAGDVLGALEDGAQDFIDKAELFKSKEESIERIIALAQNFSTVSKSQVSHSLQSHSGSIRKRPDLILIGASTGGTAALVELLQDMPPDSPPILITQHIVKTFARAFAQRLAGSAKLKLVDPFKESLLKSGHIYLALDDYHIGVEEIAGELNIKVSNASLINRHRPSVDFLFQSATKISKRYNILAVIMTGMGADGARGIKELHDLGHTTVAQDEASSVVFGMPKEAIKLGGIDIIGNPYQIRKLINESLRSSFGRPRDAKSFEKMISKVI